MASSSGTCLLLIALFNCTFKWWDNLEIQFQKWLHLKPEAAINHPAILSFSYGRKRIFNDRNCPHCSLDSRSYRNMDEDNSCLHTCGLQWYFKSFGKKFPQIWPTLKPFVIGSCWSQKWLNLHKTEYSSLLSRYFVTLSLFLNFNSMKLKKRNDHSAPAIMYANS